MPELALKEILSLDSTPMTLANFNQVLGLSRVQSVSKGFFEYFWLYDFKQCLHDIRKISFFDESFLGSKDKILSINHLYWGLYRFYIDSLLYFGSVKFAFDETHGLSRDEIEVYIKNKCFDTDNLTSRGEAFALNLIPKDDRYLVSEMACKSFSPQDSSEKGIQVILMEALEEHLSLGGGSITLRELLNGDYVKRHHEVSQDALLLAADDIINDSVDNIDEMRRKISKQSKKFEQVRKQALENTHYYLSSVSELDIYVATSMRTRENFRSMADFCDSLFSNPKLKNLNLRYFDPTLSAAVGHEDKGLIECLMVKKAKVLIYMAGERDSYGKDAEAAMALSLGKSVIFFCSKENRARMYRDIHPLSRLVSFETGVAVGAMVATSIDEVQELLYRLYNNKMQYRVDPKGNGLRLTESLTNSVVRIQSGDSFLRDTIRNFYKK